MFRFGQSMKSVRFAVLGVVLGGAVSVTQADTVAHWRFEGGDFLADSSGNGHTLTAIGSPSQVASFNGTLGGNNAASFPGGNNYFTAADDDAWEGTQLSVEALFNTTSTATTGTQIIAAHLAGAAGTATRSWYLGLANGGGGPAVRFFAEYGATGSNLRQWDLTTAGLATNTSYYIAATLDLTDGTSAARPITFYIKNLSTDGPLQTFTINHSGAAIPDGSFLRNATGPVTVGATGTPSSQFTGLLDEVRISNTELGASELLVNVPEPASLALLALGGLAILGRRRTA